MAPAGDGPCYCSAWDRRSGFCQAFLLAACSNRLCIRPIPEIP